MLVLGVMLLSMSGVASATIAECPSSPDGQHNYQLHEDGDSYYGLRRECDDHDESEGCFWVQVMQDYEYKCGYCNDVKYTKEEQIGEENIDGY